MENSVLYVQNTLTGKKEAFKPIHDTHVGMYVCGPTVYSDVHLGNCRTFISFDVIYRYLQYLGYKVRYVRNITDVGHLEGDADSGAEDKISKKARLEQIDPMEIVQTHTLGFHKMMAIFNTLPPNIEPKATGHILEQIEMVQQILDNGLAYEENGSVYFDTLKFSKDKDVYGKLSGKILDDLVAESRDDLKNQGEKRHPSDFAIWVKADPTHLMRWNSPWSVGFPGWHLECSVMSTKYLGETFDIHGGGNDLKFPHHENEIAQNFGACGCHPANYWLHTNMLLMNGKKMSKSVDPETGKSNSVSPSELFNGNNALSDDEFSPMVLRFFMLQSHYASTLNLTEEGLKGAEKAYQRLMEVYHILDELEYTGDEALTDEDAQINSILDKAFEDLNDDFNTPKALSRLFVLAPKIQNIKAGRLSLNSISKTTLNRLKTTFHDLIFTVFGLKDETLLDNSEDNNVLEGLMGLIIDIRKDARTNKDWATSDKIRDRLADAGIQLKDGKEGTSWSKN